VSNIFRDNQQGDGRGAVIAGTLASPVIARNIFTNNTGVDNGLFAGTISFWANSSPLLVNNILANNSLPAMNFSGAGSPTVLNNTIVSNSIAIRTDGGSPNCANNILEGNTIGLSVVSGSPTWSYNIVFGGSNYLGIADQTGTNGNISSEPWFACGPTGDFHLLAGSPGIDAGTNCLFLPGTDFDGHPRAIGAVDIGAYELDPSSPPAACLFLFCPADVAVMAPPGQASAIVTYPPCYATRAATVTNSMPSGSAFPLGRSMVSSTCVYGTNVLDCAFAIDVLRTNDFSLALDRSNLTWTTSGGAQWFVETTTTRDGHASAQSGAISNSQTTTLQTILTGPGMLSFWWKVSSEANHDLFSVEVNGTTQATISGEVDWQSKTIYLASGAQVVEWTYAKGASGRAGQDTAWLDQVNYAPGPVAPLITAPPANVCQVPGLSAAFSVTAAGMPPLTYQWRFSGRAIPGATNSSLIITNVQASNVGTYSVLVMNQVGTAFSPDATLTLAEVVAWGANSYGQTNVPRSLTNVAEIAGGWHHSVALKRDGSVIAWGANNKGQTNVPAGLSNVVAIASRSGDHSMAWQTEPSWFGVTIRPGRPMYPQG
jgi:hypothetical protein